MIRHCDSIKWDFVDTDDGLNPDTTMWVEEGFRKLTAGKVEKHSIRHVEFCGFLINWVLTPPFANLESCSVVHLCRETTLRLRQGVFTCLTNLEYDVAEVCFVKNIAFFFSD